MLFVDLSHDNIKVVTKQMRYILLWLQSVGEIWKTQQIRCVLLSLLEVYGAQE